MLFMNIVRVIRTGNIINDVLETITVIVQSILISEVPHIEDFVNTGDFTMNAQKQRFRIEPLMIRADWFHIGNLGSVIFILFEHETNVCVT